MSTPNRDITLQCGTRITLAELETNGLSYVPCGQIDSKDQPLFAYAHLWDKHKQVMLADYGKKANPWAMNSMTGVQLITGDPTYRGKKRLVDIDIEAHLIEKYPKVYQDILKIWNKAVDRPACIIKTKSDGRRLSAFCEYLDDKIAFKDTAGDKMVLEIFSIKGLSRLDHRYSILQGSILDIPEIEKKTIQDIYHLLLSIEGIDKPHQSSERQIIGESQLGDLDIQWDSKNRSQLFSSSYCQVARHTSNRDEVRFTRYADGSVDGKCFNCGESWWEVKPKNPPMAKAPPVEVRETPSYPHFSKEARSVIESYLDVSPDAGWHGQTPSFTTRYEHLYPLTQKFALNGQPSEVEKRRVWSTLFGNCDVCGAVTAQWIDRYHLTAGLYCDGCHKDFHIGSYLELELSRKLTNSIVSEFHGFLGDDPAFMDFRLWEPGMLTHLGAGMSTGKSTEIYKAMIHLSMQGLGKGIIAVPRVSLARFLAHHLRRRDGFRSWGLWHEGVQHDDRFIGECGAIVCLPSLPRAVKCAWDTGVERLYIAIDELDFAYNLLSLTVEQTTAVKKCLRDALIETGVVVSGQTESTLALEAFADELETDQIQAYYNISRTERRACHDVQVC